MAFLKNNTFEARVISVHVRKREELTKQAQKAFHALCVYDTIPLFSVFQPRNWQEYSLALKQATKSEHKSLMESGLMPITIHPNPLHQAHNEFSPAAISKVHGNEKSLTE